MRVPVAIYRWFEQGGAWSYDSLCAAHLGANPADQLDATFDRWLKALTPGSFTTPAEGKRAWIFFIERDNDNLDPRAREGETCILRAALLPCIPGPKQRARLEVQMRQQTPQQPGEEDSLALEVGREVLPRRWGCAFLPLVGIVIAIGRLVC